VVWVNRTPRDLGQAMYEKRRALVMGAAIILVITVALSGIIATTITHPIQALIDQTRKITAGDKSANQPIPMPVTREIALLSESVASMARTIDHRSEYIRNFATHVSHEFKTPLTSIQGTIELLQDHLGEMPEERRKQFLQNMAQDADRLERLVSRLLELAKADMSLPLESTTDILAVTQRLISPYASKGLAVTVQNSTGTDSLNALISEEVWESVLHNLLDNSLQHGAKEVCLTFDETPPNAHGQPQIAIHVHDNGPGVSDANRQQVFTPFFTTRRKEGGTGLGLSIVQSLLTRLGGDIAMSPSDTGAAFFITLRRAA
jgi:signal transduction histidine kinase